MSCILELYQVSTHIGRTRQWLALWVLFNRSALYKCVKISADWFQRTCPQPCSHFFPPKWLLFTLLFSPGNYTQKITCYLSQLTGISLTGDTIGAFPLVRYGMAQLIVLFWFFFAFSTSPLYLVLYLFSQGSKWAKAIKRDIADCLPQIGRSFVWRLLWQENQTPKFKKHTGYWAALTLLFFIWVTWLLCGKPHHGH